MTGCAVQSRIQSEILRQLADVTTVQQIPKRSFECFARTRYERELTEMVQAGRVPQSEIDNLTQQESVNQHVEENRALLEGEFRTVLALDEIYEREGLTVDEELIAAQARTTLKEAKATGATGATVRAIAAVMRQVCVSFFAAHRCGARWARCALVVAQIEHTATLTAGADDRRNRLRSQ